MAQHNLDEPLKPTCSGWTEVITSWWEGNAYKWIGRIDYGNVVRIDIYVKWMPDKWSLGGEVKYAYILDKVNRVLYGFYLDCQDRSVELIGEAKVPDPLYNHVLLLYNSINKANARRIADLIEGLFQSFTSPTFEELDEDEFVEFLEGWKRDIEDAVKGA